MKNAIANLKKQHKKYKSALSSSVDPKVEDLVTLLKEIKLNAKTLEAFIAMLSVALIFKNLYNALYFIERASKVDPPVKRNDSSFVTKAPRNTAPKRETI